MEIMNDVTVRNHWLASAGKNATMILLAKGTHKAEGIKTDVTMQQLLSVIDFVQRNMKEK